MKGAWRETDRAGAVRDAVLGWSKAGLAGDETVAAVERTWPRAGPAVGPLWRTLIALFVTVGTAALAAGLGIVSGLDDALPIALYLAVLGAGLAAATEAILERFRYAPTGAEAATSLLAVGSLTAALAIASHETFGAATGTRLAIGGSALLFAAAAWRWGFRLYAAAAAWELFGLLLRLPSPRALWIVAGAAVSLAATRALRRGDLVPAHRGGLELARAVALAATYVAVNYASVDYGIFAMIRLHGPRLAAPTSGAARFLAFAASALLPLALLAGGLRARHRGLLALGALATAASLATIRLYLHIAPLWAVLAGAGALLAAGALLLERWLKAGPDGERGGFTAAALYDERRRERLLPLAAALAAAPAGRDLPPETHVGGGGAFGGGGAGGAF